ncbi:hypothetical protein [Dyadobacter psychrophilus]|uniref:Uncharacterized protein n=1 Tax=Dyadobacter psychrophilus TaxID=651661 RepID=A0A1T5HJT3_9BACT|nr:hypothetical protein [Dyadobacter psychrophilus]SKC20879.1 hypothetical protein SAMN05660293_05737 [Dyadobacter psychrophilus]
MTNNTLKALEAYLLLSAQDKLQFLSQISEIEQMQGMVRLDYTKSLLMRASKRNVDSAAGLSA